MTGFIKLCYLRFTRWRYRKIIKSAETDKAIAAALAEKYATLYNEKNKRRYRKHSDNALYDKYMANLKAAYYKDRCSSLDRRIKDLTEK